MKFSASERMAKLQALQEKKNKCRANIKTEVEIERAEEKAGVEGKAQKEREERQKQNAEWEDNLKKEGVDPTRYKMLHETVEMQEKLDKKRKKQDTPNDRILFLFSHCSPSKYPNKAFGEDIQYHSFKRRCKNAEFSQELYDKQKEYSEAFYGEGDVSYGAGKLDINFFFLQFVNLI